MRVLRFIGDQVARPGSRCQGPLQRGNDPSIIGSFRSSGGGRFQPPPEEPRSPIRCRSLRGDPTRRSLWPLQRVGPHRGQALRYAHVCVVWRRAQNGQPYVPRVYSFLRFCFYCLVRFFLAGWGGERCSGPTADPGHPRMAWPPSLK